MKNKIWGLLILAGLLVISCKNQPKDTTGETDEPMEEESPQPSSPESREIEMVDMMVEDMERSTDMMINSKNDVTSGSFTGNAVISSSGETVRMVTFKGSANGELVERDIYLSASGEPRFFRQISVKDDCGDGNPCVKETKVYFDENGNALAAFERQADDTASKSELATKTFEEDYNFDSYNEEVDNYLDDMMNDGASDPNKIAEQTPEQSPQPSKPRYTRITYQAGTTAQASGSIQGSQTREYIVRFSGGEDLNFQLVTDNSAARLMVTNTSGRRLSNSGQDVDFEVPSAGEYLVKVFMNMGDAASKKQADYKVQIRQQ